MQTKPPHTTNYTRPLKESLKTPTYWSRNIPIGWHREEDFHQGTWTFINLYNPHRSVATTGITSQRNTTRPILSKAKLHLICISWLHSFVRPLWRCLPAGAVAPRTRSVLVFLYGSDGLKLYANCMLVQHRCCPLGAMYTSNLNVIYTGHCGYVRLSRMARWEGCLLSVSSRFGFG